MDANASVILSEHLKARGLSVTNDDDSIVSVTNPLNPYLVEAVGTAGGHYVTGWGYELGATGDEAGTAQRLAFLLGIPNGSRPDAAPTCAGKAAAVQQPREREFLTHPASVAQARAFVTAAMSAWRLSGRHDDVRLCVSELSTNAVRHADPAALSFVVRVALDDARVRVEVRDQATGLPDLRQPEADAVDGRGLFLLEAIADDWGVTHGGPDEKAVWAEFKVSLATDRER
ncbi:ATP-binding protein [Streptomyces sp. NBC_01016]|uniref:ATP-binding protein n=1 Tax=Streptomyces sp. NBC_01016 TaxID=2903720 RepID=UPI00224FA8DE|nr:ATP-binding protein [Streptomyces sp. NBC_01016]MCX4834368.1 ATP-binding protein [Streptomyces sp. NBC_01016]